MALARLRSGVPAIGTPRRVALFPLITTMVVALLVGGPLIFMLVSSVRGPLSTLPFSPSAVTTIDNYRAVFNRQLVDSLRDTAIFIGGSLTIALGLGVPLAWLLERSDIPARRLLSVLMFAPLLIPPITGAQIWSLLLGENRGILNRLIRIVLPMDVGPFSTTSASGIVFAQGMTLVPLVTLFLGTSFRNIDSTLEEASRMSGASGLQTFRRVTLKLVFPAVASVALLMSVTLLGAFEIPLVFGLGEGLTPIGVRIYTMLNPAASVPLYGQIAAYSALVTLVSFSLILVYGRLTRSAARFATVTGKGHRGAVNHLGRWRWPAFAVVAGFLVLTVGLRVFVLFWQSFVPNVGQISLAELRSAGNLEAYRSVLGDSAFWGSVRLTLVVAVLSALVTTVVPMAMAWVVVRHRGRRTSTAALDLLASTSLGIPSPVAAFAFLVMFLSINKWVPVYGTVAALTFAYCFRIGFSYRFGSAAIVQISEDLEEASAMSGAGPLMTFRRVLLPLLSPTVVFLFLLQMVTAIHEFSVPLFVRSVGDKPISIYAFNEMGAQRPTNAAAVGVLTLVAVLIVAGLAGAVSSRLRPRTS
jgi:iron(III) transport system permease protein